MDYTFPIVNALYSDSDPKAEAIQIELLRRVPAWRKIQIVAQWNEIVRNLALSGCSKAIRMLRPKNCAVRWWKRSIVQKEE